MAYERNQLHNLILDDLSSRSEWETRQRTWYKMRHNGLRRARKPGPWAADLHFPLADTIISKLKPYYFEQIYATETIASFVSLTPQNEALTSSASKWFDFQLKQRSNLETEILSLIDSILVSGRAVMKVCWDADEKELRFHAINPLHVIVPKNAISTVCSHRFAEVKVMSVDDYQRNPNYLQGEEFIKSISGDGGTNKKGSTAQEQEKFRREGITYGANANEIVLWEVYEKDGDEWVIHTYSPLKPEQNVRESMKVPYRHGQPPFVDFCYEIKDKGWYSPRGICELVAPHEASLCRLWNEKHDCMTLYNRPLFVSDRDIPNGANIEMAPGQILPFRVEPVRQGQPPISFDQEMLSTRQVAEQRVAMPDYGMNQVMNTQDRRTATEIQAVSEVMGNASDLRARIFRKSLCRLYRLAWETLKEFKSKDLKFYFNTIQHELNPEALKGEYEITPHGSPDGVSKVFIMQKAVQRFQMLNNDPYINQIELRRSVLESDDASLSTRLLVDPNTTQATQQEDQADEISILNIGFPARVLPSDDHAVHIQTCVEYLVSRQKLGVEFNQIAHQRILEHIALHLEELSKSDPKLARQIQKGLQNLATQLEPQAEVAA